MDDQELRERGFAPVPGEPGKWQREDQAEWIAYFVLIGGEPRPVSRPYAYGGNARTRRLRTGDYLE